MFRNAKDNSTVKQRTLIMDLLKLPLNEHMTVYYTVCDMETESLNIFAVCA